MRRPRDVQKALGEPPIILSENRHILEVEQEYIAVAFRVGHEGFSC